MPTADDLISAIKEVVKFEQHELRLWDLRHGANLSADDLKNVADIAKSEKFKPSKIAVVAPDDLAFGLARMHEVYREQKNQEYQVFRTEQAATKWLLADKK